MSKVRMQGVVLSRSGDKTVRVEVSRLQVHPRVKKRIRRASRFLAHDEENAAAVGDLVEIQECRPRSARKRFEIVEVVEKAG